MRRLVLVRHAKTERDSDSGKDQDRKLDPRGHTDSGLIADWLSDQPIEPNLVLVSSAVRTRETWDIFSSVMTGSKVAFRDDLYLASAADIIQIIRATPASIKTLMVIGHNPGLHEVAWTLSGNAEPADRNALSVNFPTTAVAVIDFPITDWKKMMPQKGTLSLYITPRQLKDNDGR